MEPIAFIILLFFVCLVAFIFLFNSFFTEKKNRKDSVNHDSSKTYFYYLLETNKETAIEKLTIRNINDILDFTFDPDAHKITFSHREVNYDFDISFYNLQSYSYMIAKSNTPMDEHSNFPVVVNSFFGKKLNTTPVEAHYFEALLKNNNIELK